MRHSPVEQLTPKSASLRGTTKSALNRAKTGLKQKIRVSATTITETDEATEATERNNRDSKVYSILSLVSPARSTSALLKSKTFNQKLRHRPSLRGELGIVSISKEEQVVEPVESFVDFLRGKNGGPEIKMCVSICEGVSIHDEEVRSEDSFLELEQERGVDKGMKLIFDEKDKSEERKYNEVKFYHAKFE